ncbi:MAG: hypothetical protein ACYC2I_01415 [Elusimicrobiales bacterium]
MRYWAYINNEVKGPFEKGKLAAQAGFGPSSVVCPEDQAAGQNPGWKEASNYPDLMEALSRPAAPGPEAAPEPAPAAAPEAKPAPEPAPAARPAESPLAMTMRGTLISDPVADGQVVERFPAAAPAALTPPSAVTPPLPAVPPQAAGPRDGQVMQKLDQMSAMLASIANGQSQAQERLDRVEKAVLQMRSLLFPAAPQK